MGATPSFLRRMQQPQQALPAAFDGKRVLAWNAAGELFGDQPVTRAAGTGIIKPVDGTLQLPGDTTTYFSLASAIVLPAPYSVLIWGKVPSGSDAYFCGNAATTSDWIWGTSASGFRVRGAGTTAVFGNPIAGKTSLFVVCCDNKGSSAFRAYQDAVSLGADSNAIGAVSLTLASIGRGRSDVAAIPANSSIGMLAVIPGYALPVEAVRELGNNPWRIFGPVRRRIWAMGAAGGALNASGSGTDVADGSAALSVQVALAAVGVALANGSANAGVAVPLSATGLDVASGAANGMATISISAAGLAQAAATAGLSASVLLAAAGAALAAGNAALAAQLQAMAAGADQASGTANLSSQSGGQIAAAGSDVSSGSAVLAINVRLQATGGDVASGTANGTASAPGALAASGGDVATGWATWSSLVTLTAAGFVQAMGAGAFSVTVPIAATGQSTTTGVAGGTVAGAVRNFRIKSGVSLLTRVATGVQPKTRISHGVSHG